MKGIYIYIEAAFDSFSNHLRSGTTNYPIKAAKFTFLFTYCLVFIFGETALPTWELTSNEI